MLKLISKSFSRDRVLRAVNTAQQQSKDVKLASEAQGNKLRELVCCAAACCPCSPFQLHPALPAFHITNATISLTGL